MSSPRSSSVPWRSGWEGAKAHFWPGLALQAAALGLVLAYYHCAPVGAALSRLMQLRQTMGFGLSMISTAIFGGLLPFLYLRSLQDPRPAWRQGLGLTAFWAYKGFEIDLFYRILAHTVGAGHDAGTIVRKMAIDQFLYSPIFAVPATVAAFQWAEARWNLAALSADLREPRWYVRRVLPVMISNLGVWIPAVAIIYALPTPLQLPLQNLVLCFYTLVIAHQTRAACTASTSLARACS